MKYRVTIDLTVRGRKPSFLEVKEFMTRAIVNQSEQEPTYTDFSAIAHHDVTIGSIIGKGSIDGKAK